MLKSILVGLVFGLQVMAAPKEAPRDPAADLTAFFQLKQDFRNKFFQIFETYVNESAEVFKGMSQTMSGPEALGYTDSCLAQNRVQVKDHNHNPVNACIQLEAIYAEFFSQYDLKVFNKFETSLFKMVDDFNAATADLEKNNKPIAEMAQSSREFLLAVYMIEAKRKVESFQNMQRVSLFKDHSKFVEKASWQNVLMKSLFLGIAESNQELHQTYEKYTF